MTPCFSLPGISAIAFIRSSDLLPDLTLQALADFPITINPEPTPIPFTGDATCETTQTNASVGPSQTAELSFLSRLQLPTDHYLAFLLTDANGQTYLLGTREDHPLIERIQSFGSPSADPSTFTYRVELSAPIALIPVTLP